MGHCGPIWSQFDNPRIIGVWIALIGDRWTLRSKTIGKDWQIGTRTQSHRLSLPCSPVELKRTTIINPSTSNQSWIRRAGWNVDVKVPPQSTNECFSNSTLEILPTLEGRAFQEAVCISFTCWGPERHAADVWHVMTCDDMWWHVQLTQDIQSSP